MTNFSPRYTTNYTIHLHYFFINDDEAKTTALKFTKYRYKSITDFYSYTIRFLSSSIECTAKLEDLYPDSDW